MHRILIVTPHRDSFASLAACLEKSQDVQVAWADSGQAAIADLIKHPPLGMIIDEDLHDMTGLDLVRRLLPVNALVNTAVVSALPSEAFHEASEGLGVMAQLPPHPTPEDARTILANFRRMALARGSPKVIGDRNGAKTAVVPALSPKKHKVESNT
jgi:CheY-like chemotaxis protein